MPNRNVVISTIKVACPACGRQFYGRVNNDTKEKREKHLCGCGTAMTYRIVFDMKNTVHIMSINARI